MRGTILLFGLLTALGVAAFVLLEFFLGLHTTRLDAGEYTKLLEPVLALAILFLGMRTGQKRGSLSRGWTISTGLLITLLGALLTTAFMLTYHRLINPSLIDLTIARERDRLASTGMPDEILVQKVNEMRLRYGLGAQLIWGFLRQVIFGAACSVLFSLILPTGKPSHHGEKKMMRSL